MPTAAVKKTGVIETRHGPVPAAFIRGKHPTAYTVEQLIAQLKRLPPKLPIQLGFDPACKLVVVAANENGFERGHYLLIDETDP